MRWLKPVGSTVLVLLALASVVATIAPGCQNGGTPVMPDLQPQTPDAGPQKCGDVGPNNWKAQDLGKTAQTVDSGEEQANLNGIWGENENAVIAVGSKGKAIHFDGKAWRTQATPTGETLTAVHGTSERDVWAVGFSGTVIHWNGTAWEDRSPPLSLTQPLGQDAGPPTGDAAVAARKVLWGVYASGNAKTGTDTLYVVGERGLILSRKGNLWSRLPSDPGASPPGDVPDHLNGVWGTSATKVFIVGDFGTILVGPPFAKQATGIAKALKGVWGRNDGDVYAVGLTGTVLHLSGGAWNAVAGAPKQFLRAVWGPPSDASTVYIVGWDGTLIKLSGGPSFSNGAEYLTYNCVTGQRLEGIWGTMVAGPAPDGGAPVSDAGIPQVPRIFVSGVSGTVIGGP